MNKSWTIKEVEHWRIDAFELWCWRRLLGIPWTVRRSNQSIPKGNQPWIFTGRTDAEALILWPLDAKSGLTGKDPDVGKDWRQEGKEVTGDENVRKHHWLNAHEFNQTLEGNGGQRNFVCYSPWGCKETVKIWWLNNILFFFHPKTLSPVPLSLYCWSWLEGFSPQPVLILWHKMVSFKWMQFCHWPPGVAADPTGIRAQSHKTVLTSDASYKNCIPSYLYSVDLVTKSEVPTIPFPSVQE